MKFDSNLAWKQASSAIIANRDVLLALAGVFFLLPSLALALLFPSPEIAQGPSREEMMAILSEYYTSLLPYLIPIVLFQATGTLAMLTLLTDRTRPTVGEAIRLGIGGIVPYVLAQIVLGIGIGIIGGTVLAAGVATGVAVIAATSFAVVIAVALYAAIKTSLVAPIIAVEGERNPIEALKRSWRLTKGNSVRIALFYFLVGVAFLVVIMIVTAILGIMIALLAGPHVTKMVGDIIASAMNAVMALYFVAIVAAVHRQLAGPSPETESATFE